MSEDRPPRPTLPRSAIIPKPPFVRLPDPGRRSSRAAPSASGAGRGHDLAPYLGFLAGLAEAQHRGRRTGSPRRRCRRPRRSTARGASTPCRRSTAPASSPDPAFGDAARPAARPLAAASTCRRAARAALDRVAAADDATRARDGRRTCWPTRSRSRRSPSTRLVAAALQVHFARARRRARCRRAGAGGRRGLPRLRRPAVRQHGRRLAAARRAPLLRLRALRHALELRAHQVHALRLDRGHLLSGDRGRRRHGQGRDLRRVPAAT